MAEIEVLLDFGTPYVRLDDYNAMKERYWRQAGLTQTADDEAATWKEHARALTARAEAAEAERDDLRERHDNLKTAYANLVQEAADRLTRMYSAEAELEAQLAAQAWRPVTDDEPEEATEVELLVVGYRDGGNWYYHDDNPIRGWQPLPAPAPDTEPTP